VHIGDLWCIAAAAASALFILRLESFSNAFDAKKLNGASFATVASLCGLWLAGDLFSSSGGIADSTLQNVVPLNLYEMLILPVVRDPFPIIYLGGITTALCNYLQVRHPLNEVYCTFNGYSYFG
jgi:hypothetical protein